MTNLYPSRAAFYVDFVKFKICEEFLVKIREVQFNTHIGPVGPCEVQLTIF